MAADTSNLVLDCATTGDGVNNRNPVAKMKVATIVQIKAKICLLFIAKPTGYPFL